MTKIYKLMFSMMIMLAFSFSTAFAQKSFVQIGTGTTSNNLPFYGSWNNTWSKIIYFQSEIGAAKTISHIGFDMKPNLEISLTNQKIYMKHTSAASVSTSYEDPLTNGYTLVFNGTINLNTGGWNTIDITDFVYNGTDNLIFIFEDRNNASHYKNFNCTDYTGSRVAISGCDVSNCFPISGGNAPYPTAFPNIQLHFTPPVTNPVTPVTVLPMHNSWRVPVDIPFKFNIGANTTKYDLFLGTSPSTASMTKIASDVAATTPGTYTYNHSTLLNSKTTYYWYVKAKNDLGNADSSSVQYFKTQKVVTTLPWSYGFEDSTAFYPGWYGDTTKVDWYYASTPNWGRAVNDPLTSFFPAHNGKACAYINVFSSTPISYSLQTPRFIIPANTRISFWYKNGSASKTANSDTTYFEVTKDGGATWTTLGFISPEAAMNNYAQSPFYNLSSYAGNNVYFRWRYNSVVLSSKAMYIDDIVLEEMYNGPMVQLSETALNYNPIAVGGRYKKAITITNTGSQNLTINSLNIDAPFTCSYNGMLTPMEVDTAYVYYTPSSLGSHSGNLIFHTNNAVGDTVISLAGNAIDRINTVTESFDAVPVNEIPSGWFSMDSPDPYQTSNWVNVRPSTYENHSAPNSLKFQNSSDSISPLLAILPAVKNYKNSILKFWAQKSYDFGTTPLNYLEVGLMENPYDASTYVMIDTFHLESTNLMQREMSVTFNSNDTLYRPYIVFRHGNNHPFQSIYVDDVKYQKAVVNSVPNAAVIISPADGAIDQLQKPTLKWQDGGGYPTGYKIYGGTDMGTLDYLGSVATTSYIFPANIAYGTTYYWKIVPFNAFGDAVGCPTWSFTTMDNPLITVFPWSENFDAITNQYGPTAPIGWTIENKGMQSMYWDIIANTPMNPNNANSAPNAINIYFSFLGKLNDYVCTPPMALDANKSYILKYWHKETEEGNAGSMEKMDINLGTAPDSAHMNVQNLYEGVDLVARTYEEAEIHFRPNTTGNYHIGFWAHSEQLQGGIYLDDISLEENTNPSSDKQMIGFGIIDPSVGGNINESAKTISIVVPQGTNLTNLVANFDVSTYAVVKVNGNVQKSGVTPNDFSSPVVYRVLAEDNTYADYTVTVSIDNAIADVYIKNIMQMYPNPSNGVVYVKSLSNGNLTITNTLGQVVYNSTINANEIMNVKDLNSGIYNVSIETNSTKITQKLVVK